MIRSIIISFLAFTLSVMTASAEVLFNGKKAAVDNLTGTWLISVPKAVFGNDYTASVTLSGTITQFSIDGVEISDSVTFNNVQPGATYHLHAVDGSKTINADIQFTYWPVIQIYGTFVKRPYATATVVYTHPDSSLQETISSRVRWAGSSTTHAERKKRNYHLKFYNEDGTKMNKSFFGLRSDFHWRLDAGQIDFARVRNRVCKDIWADFSSAPYYAAYEPKTVRNYFRGDFVEVFVNDEYMGIYSLNEHMDRQQMKLKQYDYEKGEFHGGLWKPMQLTSTTLFKELPAFDATSKNWDEFVIKYPNIDDVTPTNYQTLHDAIYFTMNSTDAEFLDSAKYYFDIPVFRDYYLFTTLMQAPDNYGKNLYYACYDVATDPRLTIGIWDLDCTQGQYWSNSINNYHHAESGPEVEFYKTMLSEHLVFKRLYELDSSFHGLATERYWELRSTVFNPDSIMARYRAYFDEMKACGADQREIRRWTGGIDLGYHVMNFDTEYEYLHDWWTRHIAFLDEHIFVPYPECDVNFDRKFSINDVIILIDYLLGAKPEGFNSYKADYDQNGTISIKDVVNMIDKLIQQSDI